MDKLLSLASLINWFREAKNNIIKKVKHMGTVSFTGKPKEQVAAEREARANDPNYVPPEDRINVLKGVLSYKPGHQKQQVRRYCSFKPDVQDFDVYVDECIKDAVTRGVINFIYTTPGNIVYIGILPAV